MLVQVQVAQCTALCRILTPALVSVHTALSSINAFTCVCPTPRAQLTHSRRQERMFLQLDAAKNRTRLLTRRHVVELLRFVFYSSRVVASARV